MYYFKLIDIFETEKTLHIVFTFVIGSIIPFIIYPIHEYIYKPLDISNSENPLLSFLFFSIGVGLLEEFVKAASIFLVMLFFKNAINEPIDYLKYICISALGFAFGENIEYAVNCGHAVLLTRSIISVPAHMIFSSLFIYGYILYKYQNKPITIIPTFAALGFMAHGLFDFFLDDKNAPFGHLTNILFFLCLIEVFILILNNGINNSPFYSPKKAIDQQKVRKYLSRMYTFAIISIIIFCGISQNAETAISAAFAFIFFYFLLLYIIIVRLSRISIVPGHWKTISLAFPFYYDRDTDRNDRTLFGVLNIKGESYNDYEISRLYEENIKVIPMSSRKTYLPKTLDGRIEKKMHLGEEAVYMLKLIFDESQEKYKYYLVKAKTNGITHSEDKHPIVSLNTLSDTHKNTLIFHEWVILKKVD